VGRLQAVHQLIPHLAYGDGIGNQVFELRRLLRAAGYASDIFCESWDARLKGECQRYERYLAVSEAANIILYHYCASGPSNEFVLGVPDRVALYYHNLTPPIYYYRTNGAFAAQLAALRANLARLAGRFPAIAGSPHNQTELEALGFRVIGVVPYSVSFISNGTSSQGVAPHTWLHVGRLAPNKCLEEVIDAFARFRIFDPGSRLGLIGSANGNERYAAELRAQAERLHLGTHVTFAGQVTRSMLVGYYRSATVYVCLSEHEGFCVPLVEAMHFGVPVIAYAATGVPDTLGPAGIALTHKHPAVIAAIAAEIMENAKLRQQLIVTGRARAADFTIERTRTQLLSVLAALVHVTN
jgi:glycosyltransferase involved in cell wall biosynthesis